MADVAPPRHPVTSPADVNTYAPYAVLAVIALVVALFYAVLFGALAVMSFRSGQPFIQPPMLALPAAAVVLAYAARRQIQNAEGTRAGMQLVNAAWWIAVVGGVGYAAYLVTYQAGVRQDAANSFQAWAKNLNEVDLSDPKNPGFFYVFEGSLDPEKQGRFKVGQADVVAKQLKQQWAAARQSFFVRLANRNRGGMAFEVGGLDNWEQDATGQKCQLPVTVRCPEGEFTSNVPMQAKRIDGQWRWQIGLTPTGNLSATRVTPYGQFITDTVNAGFFLAHDAFLPATQVQPELPALLPIFAGKSTAYPGRNWLEARAVGRMAVLGGAGGPYPEPPDYDAQIGKYFEPVEKADPAEEARERREFVRCWRSGRIVPPGRTIQGNQDQQPLLSVLKDALELRVPVELQAPGAMVGARGALVLRIDDPAYLAKADSLRKSAATDPLQEPVNRPPSQGEAPWRLYRIESDMKAVTPERMPQMGAGGGAGM